MTIARVRLAGLSFYLILLAGLPLSMHAQCISPELVMINSCIEHPNPNGGPVDVESEIIIMRTGLVPVAVNTIGVDLPFNGFGPENSDLGYDTDGLPYGCDYKEPTITTLPGCPDAIPAGPDDVIPANAFVVLFLTGTTVTGDVDDTDFANICTDGRPVYILQSACERTTGAFANGPGQGDPLRSILVSSPCGPRIFTYNTSELDPDDGTYYLVGTSVTGNQDCDIPFIPPTCSPLDTVHYLCGYGDTVDPPVPVSEFEVLFPDDILVISFHHSPEDAELNQNRISEYSGSTSEPDTLYSRVIYSADLCTSVASLIVRFSDDPLQAVSPAEPVRGCDPLSTGIGTFNLRIADAEIGNGAPITWYTNSAATQEISNPENFQSPETTVYAVAGLAGCAGNPAPVTLELIPGPDVNPTVTPVSCFGVSDGSIHVESSGFGSFSYDWDVDVYDGDDSITSLPAGMYHLTVTDRYSCATERSFDVADGQPLAIGCSLVQETSGPGTSDGIVEITFSDGSSPYQLTYTGAAAGAMEVNGASVNITGLPAGDYTFSATDANGCASEECTVTVLPPNPLTISCRTRNNSNDVDVLGSGQVEINGGDAPFLVTVTDALGNSSNFPNRPNGVTNIPNLPSGDYTVTVTDMFGQTEECTITIALVACPLTIVEVQQFANDCSGSDNTIIRLTIAGNQGAISTTWSGGNGIESFDGMQEAGPLPAGIYFVMVEDQSGCPGITEGPIVVTDPGVIDYTVGGDLSASPCQNDARLDVTVNGGGSPPYSIVLIDWNSMVELDRITDQAAGSTVSFNDLAGGGAPDYAVYVIDALGCETDRTFNPITATPGPAIVLDPADQQISSPSCAGDSTGSLSVLASGGTAPYVYRWIDYPQLASGRILPEGPDQTDLPGGNYTIELTDMNGCMDTAMVVVPQGTMPTISCGTTTSAVGSQGGSVEISFGGGVLPYAIFMVRDGNQQGFLNLTGPDEVIPDLEPGDYAAVVTDANGCTSDTCTFTIPLSPCNLSAVAEIDTIFCSDSFQGGISVMLSGGAEPYNYTWETGVTGDSSEVTVIAEGNYAVTIEDANGCSLDTSFFVPDIMNRADLVLEVPRYLPACPGEDVRIPLELQGIAPFTLEYTLTPTPGTTLTRTFNSNQQFDTLLLSPSDFIDPDLVISMERLTDRYCDAQIIEMFAVRYTEPDTVRRFEVVCENGPLEIGGRFFDPQTPSDTFLLDDGSTCGVLYEVDLDFQMVMVPDTVIVPACPATPYTTGGETFDANRPEGEVRYPRAGLCDSVVYIRLDILPEYIGSYTENACVGDTIYYADRVFTAENTSGLARLPGMAASGCDSVVFVSTNFRRTGEVRLFGDFEICPGEPIELRFTYDGPGSINVRMTDLAGNISDLTDIRQGSRVELFPTESTSYQLLSSAIGGCPGEVAGSSSVEVNDLSIATEVPLDPGDYCQDTLGRAVVSYTGGVAPYEVRWSNGPTDSINWNLLAGTYQVSVTDALGCELTDSVTLSNLEPLTARVTGISPDCPGAPGRLQIDTVFGGGGFYEVSIDGQFYLPIENVGDFEVPVGNHTAVFQGANDCSVAVNFRVEDAPTPDFNLPTDTTIFLGDSLFLDGSLLNQDSAWWTPADFLSNPDSSATWATPLSSSTVTLHLRTLAQCLFTHQVNITVDERLPVYAPTAFSPNGDGVNDLYELGLGRNVRALRSFQIFNRWGNIMYDGIDAWDGEFAGDSAPPAVYVFYAVVEMADGSERLVKGDFVLMR
ncbi:T9SS type B sorting domain-containing protein [Neolewinella aurantiaca]|uniref:T9SS type B sorting domain-containing protein n=1 Tax=Neolewinella aurantiaca TaxID=2602767 RepID=A0A5C7FHM4_9BACT|nr:gliding motility-associated C-terminal domain-containing protein [Neolewinella aurantiaca]TXF90724.1 T9SS type B sorting domain-containing protein [Neolewinella aurantiaca]